MLTENYLSFLPDQCKKLVGLFLIVLSVGYFTGIGFVKNTTEFSPEGTVENYLGNESNQKAEVMKFRKSDREILTIVHTHILSMSVIFFILAILVYGVSIPSKIKGVLLLEPLISVLVTFGGIYLIWLGFPEMSYVVMLSGSLMTVSFIVSVLLVFREILRKPVTNLDSLP